MAVVEADDEHREAEDVRGEDELLALVVGDVAGAREEVDRGEPLLLGELDLAGEGVQVAHQALHHLAQARVRRVLEARLDRLREVGIGEVAALDGARGGLLGHAATMARCAERVKGH
jgi:hypothetical protein